MEPGRNHLEALLDAHQHLLSTPNIVSLAWREKRVGGQKTGRRALCVGVIQKKRPGELKAPDVVVPATVSLQVEDGRGGRMELRVETDVVEEGEIRDAGTVVALGREDDSPEKVLAVRPALGGDSVRVTALGFGTLGVNIQFRGRYRLLGNAHVLTQYDGGQVGQMIYSPGVVKPSNALVPITGQEPVRFYTDPLQQNPVENVYDVAWADITPALGSPNIRALPVNPPAGLRAPANGEDITMYGAVSGQYMTFIESLIARYRSAGVDLHGRAIYTWWRSGIQYGSNFTAGDSGAALVADSDNHVVGLHRASSGLYSYGCPLP